MCRINGRNVTYTPKQTTEYEKMVRASYTAVSKIFFEKDIPLEISITALFSIPRGKLLQPSRAQNLIEEKSTIARVQNSVARDKLKNSNKSSFANCPTARWPTKKPDSDNIIKIILDGLKGVCYHDDAQICRVIFEKQYAEIPETKITIREIIL